MTCPALEILNPDRVPRGTVRAAVFDFDGTISTLRCGWEGVMGPMMLEFLSPGKAPDAALAEEVRRYIDENLEQTLARIRTYRGKYDGKLLFMALHKDVSVTS